MSTSQGLCSSPHGNSPFPTFREAHGQSTTSSQGAYSGQPRYQRRSPPLGAQIIPGQIYRAASPFRHTASPDDSTEPPPAPIDALNRQNNLHHTTPQQDLSPSQSALLQHRANQMTPALDSVPHPVRPRFRSLNGFRLTPELIAEIGLSHSMRPGMSGMAYAGGALSGPVSRSTQLEPSSLPNESTLERFRSGRSLVLGESGETPTGTKVQSRNTTPRDQGRETWELHRRGSVVREPSQRMPAQQPSPTLDVLRTNSPKYIPSLSDPSDHPASYNPGDREFRSALASPSPLVRSQVSCAESLRSTPHSVARIPDRSLPIQEESEEYLVAYEQNDGQEQERERRILGESEDRPPTHKHELELRDPGRERSASSPPVASSDPVAAHDHGRHHSPMALHPLAGSPISPNPHNHTTATPPSPIVSGMSREKGKKPIRPPYGHLPRVDSAYPNPFEHIRRRSYAGSDNETLGNPQINSNFVREQLALQMQIFALNNGGMVSDSTLSPSSAPFPGPQHNPWTFLHTSNTSSGRRSGITDEQASTRSSPSQQPVPVPSFSRGYRRQRRRERSQDSHRYSKTRPPPRIESTQPRDTSPELSSSEESSVESRTGERQSEPQKSVPQHLRSDESADYQDEAEADDEKWIDEDLGVEGGADGLLQLEFHPDFVVDAKRRRQRWKLRWESLLRDFHALDRETNTTFVLLAAPSHTGKLHSVASRTVRRDSSFRPTEMKHIRSAFARIATRQHAARTPSLLEQLSRDCLSSYEGPSTSASGAREEDLLRALDTAIGSLQALGTIYERREERWAEEKLRLDEDNDRVQLLLKQVLGPGVFGDLTNRAR